MPKPAANVLEMKKNAGAMLRKILIRWDAECWILNAAWWGVAEAEGGCCRWWNRLSVGRPPWWVWWAVVLFCFAKTLFFLCVLWFFRPVALTIKLSEVDSIYNNNNNNNNTNSNSSNDSSTSSKWNNLGASKRIFILVFRCDFLEQKHLAPPSSNSCELFILPC